MVVYRRYRITRTCLSSAILKSSQKTAVRNVCGKKEPIIARGMSKIYDLTRPMSKGQNGGVNNYVMHSNHVKLRPRLMGTADNRRTELLRTYPVKNVQSRPQSPRPLDQRSGSAWAPVESKTGTRKSWFRFDSARVSEIVVEMNKFQQPMRFARFFGGLSV